MTEASLKTTIETTLSIPCFSDGDSIIFPGATLDVYRESPGVYGDGKGKSTVNSCQVDLWYTDRASRDTATSSLLGALSLLECTTPTVERFYDKTAKKFRATFHFEFI